MSQQRTTVLYIAGAGRSASTLLGHILGQLEGFCFIGEMIGAWRAFGVRHCGCRVPLTECKFWADVRRAAGRDGRSLPPEELFALGPLARWRNLPLTFGPGPPIARRCAASLRSAQSLYESVAAVSGARVIVDSSKSVPYARMLSLLPGLDLRIVHLVRDARAVAYSWSRLKPVPDRPDQSHMDLRRPGKVAVNWLISNVGTELLGRARPGRYVRLRYEDLVDRPRESLERILRPFIGAPAALPLTGERTIEIHPTHSVKGNPDRFGTGTRELRIDDEWRHAMRPGDRRLVTGLTWPLLLRHGYAP